jgi:hypothetical protein
MPVDWSNYPKNWKQISAAIRLDRAGDQCEWHDWIHESTASYLDRCQAMNGEPHPLTGSKVVLTVAHLDHDTWNSAPANLMAMCQLHHNRYDAKHRAANRKRKLEAKSHVD